MLTILGANVISLAPNVDAPTTGGGGGGGGALEAGTGGGGAGGTESDSGLSSPAPLRVARNSLKI